MEHNNEMPQLSNALSSTEISALGFAEEKIEAGLKSFYEVGDALLQIRDYKLYRSAYATFEDYCEQKWGISRPRAYQLIDASYVKENLSTIVDTPLPENEAQARELAEIPAPAQAIAWATIIETAPNKKVTAAHIKSVAVAVNEMLETGALDVGEGDMLPLSDAVKARITEETYERMKRQEQHIKTAMDKKAAKMAEQAAKTTELNPAAMDALMAKGGVHAYEIPLPDLQPESFEGAVNTIMDMMTEDDVFTTEYTVVLYAQVIRKGD